MGWVHMASGSPSVLICLQHSDDQKYMTLLMCGTEKSKRILRGHLYHTSLFFKQVKLSSKRPWDPPKDSGIHLGSSKSRRIKTEVRLPFREDEFCLEIA